MGLEVGFAGKVQVAADTAGTAGAFSSLGATSKASITPKNLTQDVTQVNQPNGGGYVQRKATVKDADIKASLYFIAGGADAGYVICLNSFTGGVPMWIKVWKDATLYDLAYVVCTALPTAIDPKAVNNVDVGFDFSGNPDGNTINNGLTGSPYAATVILGIS